MSDDSGLSFLVIQSCLDTNSHPSGNDYRKNTQCDWFSRFLPFSSVDLDTRASTIFSLLPISLNLQRPSQMYDREPCLTPEGVWGLLVHPPPTSFFFQFVPLFSSIQQAVPRSSLSWRDCTLWGAPTPPSPRFPTFQHFSPSLLSSRFMFFPNYTWEKALIKRGSPSCTHSSSLLSPYSTSLPFQGPTAPPLAASQDIASPEGLAWP